MNLTFYTGVLLSFFKDRRVINNIEQMIKKIITEKTIRLYTVAEDTNEYNRFKSLIDGSLKSVLDNKKISEALRKNSSEAMSGQKQITLIHFPK
jgi:vacuolar-type H+-ATPase subunit E/Vma4